MIKVLSHFGGATLRQVPIPDRLKVVTDEVDPVDETPCQVCGSSDNEDRLLLCDRCDAGYHMECLIPPLDSVPVEEWFCPICMPRPRHLPSEEEHTVHNSEVNHRVASAPVTRAIARTRHSERVRGRVNERRIARSQRSTDDGLSYMDDIFDAIISGLNISLPPARIARGRMSSKTRRRKARASKKRPSSSKKRKRKRKPKRKAKKRAKRSTASTARVVRSSRGSPSCRAGRLFPRSRRVDIGAPSFLLFENPNRLLSFDSDDSNGRRSPCLDNKLHTISQLAQQSHQPVARPIAVGSTGRIVGDGGTPSASLDLLGSILADQDLLLRDSSDVLISRDGALRHHVPDRVGSSAIHSCTRGTTGGPSEPHQPKNANKDCAGGYGGRLSCSAPYLSTSSTPSTHSNGGAGSSRMVSSGSSWHPVTSGVGAESQPVDEVKSSCVKQPFKINRSFPWHLRDEKESDNSRDDRSPGMSFHHSPIDLRPSTSPKDWREQSTFGLMSRLDNVKTYDPTQPTDEDHDCVKAATFGAYEDSMVEYGTVYDPFRPTGSNASTPPSESEVAQPSPMSDVNMEDGSSADRVVTATTWEPSSSLNTPNISSDEYTEKEKMDINVSPSLCVELCSKTNGSGEAHPLQKNEVEMKGEKEEEEEEEWQDSDLDTDAMQPLNILNVDVQRDTDGLSIFEGNKMSVDESMKMLHESSEPEDSHESDSAMMQRSNRPLQHRSTVDGNGKSGTSRYVDNASSSSTSGLSSTVHVKVGVAKDRKSICGSNREMAAVVKKREHTKDNALSFHAQSDSDGLSHSKTGKTGRKMQSDSQECESSWQTKSRKERSSPKSAKTRRHHRSRSRSRSPLHSNKKHRKRRSGSREGKHHSKRGQDGGHSSTSESREKEPQSRSYCSRSRDSNRHLHGSSSSERKARRDSSLSPIWERKEKRQMTSSIHRKGDHKYERELYSKRDRDTIKITIFSDVGTGGEDSECLDSPLAQVDRYLSHDAGKSTSKEESRGGKRSSRGGKQDAGSIDSPRLTKEARIKARTRERLTKGKAHITKVDSDSSLVRTHSEDENEALANYSALEPTAHPEVTAQVEEDVSLRSDGFVKSTICVRPNITVKEDGDGSIKLKRTNNADLNFDRDVKKASKTDLDIGDHAKRKREYSKKRKEKPWKLCTKTPDKKAEGRKRWEQNSTEEDDHELVWSPSTGSLDPANDVSLDHDGDDRDAEDVTAQSPTSPALKSSPARLTPTSPGPKSTKRVTWEERLEAEGTSIARASYTHSLHAAQEELLPTFLSVYAEQASTEIPGLSPLQIDIPPTTPVQPVVASSQELVRKLDLGWAFNRPVLSPPPPPPSIVSVATSSPDLAEVADVSAVHRVLPTAGLMVSQADKTAITPTNRVSHDKYLKKLNIQERAVEEVKVAIKPFYQSKDIDKNEYKEIVRKAVHKICHSKSGEINPVKVANLVKGYIEKYKLVRKMTKKREQEKAVSSAGARPSCSRQVGTGSARK
uniref:PHD and RING finger domain-containing protein 1 isoform X2 n=1 Tax=Myxine glutinosa TaxID=7769 RepID=UPI00358E2F53